MELRQLEYFQMASRLKNITRAAERLKVSQANITVAIKKLEAELGVQLFDRSQKQLTLTPEGTVFLNRIDIALRNIQDALLELNDYKQLQKGSIKIGIPPMIGAYLFPKIFSDFRQLHSNLDIYIYEEGSIAIREQLERDELDFGIVITTNAPSNLQLFQMSTNQIVACLPNDHLLANKTTISFNDIHEDNLIMLKSGSYLRQAILTEFDKHNIAPRIILESNQIETIKGLVASGVGISFLLDVIVHNETTLKAIPLTEAKYVDIGLAWKKDKYVSKAAQAFIDFCKTHLTVVQQ